MTHARATCSEIKKLILNNINELKHNAPKGNAKDGDAKECMDNLIIFLRTGVTNLREDKTYEEFIFDLDVVFRDAEVQNERNKCNPKGSIIFNGYFAHPDNSKFVRQLKNIHSPYTAPYTAANKFMRLIEYFLDISCWKFVGFISKIDLPHDFFTGSYTITDQELSCPTDNYSFVSGSYKIKELKRLTSLWEKIEQAAEICNSNIFEDPNNYPHKLDEIFVKHIRQLTDISMGIIKGDYVEDCLNQPEFRDLERSILTMILAEPKKYFVCDRIGVTFFGKSATATPLLVNIVPDQKDSPIAVLRNKGS